MHTLSFTYNADLLRRMYWREVRRTHGSWVIAAAVCLALGLWLSASPDTSWPGGVAIGVAAAYFGGLYAQSRASLRFAGVPFQAVVSETGLVITSPLSSTTLPWTSIRSVDEAPDGLALRLSLLGRPVHLPRPAVTEEIAAFVRAHIPIKGSAAA